MSVAGHCKTYRDTGCHMVGVIFCPEETNIHDWGSFPSLGAENIIYGDTGSTGSRLNPYPDPNANPKPYH